MSVTKEEIIEKVEKLTAEDIFPYLNNEKYKNLFARFIHSKESNTDDFFVSELIKIYADTKDENIQVRILELLKECNM